MNTKVSLLLGLVVVAVADRPPAYSYGAPRYSQDSSEESFESYESSEAQYNFQWAVKDGYSRNDFGHQEARDGDNTQGSYYVQLPDGRLQTVSYRVDGYNGYIADVNYEGEAQYPSAESASYESFEVPRYVPPRASYGVARYPSAESASYESFEVPRYAAPRASYGVARYPSAESASYESFEVPRYAPPRVSYYDSNESK